MTNSDNRLTGRLMFGNDPVLQAAWLYYQSGLSQTEVADAMGISRVTVVKYLQTAQENGVVHISLDMARYSRIDMALSLKKVQSDQCAGGTGQPGYGGGGRFRPLPGKHGTGGRGVSQSGD